MVGKWGKYKNNTKYSTKGTPFKEKKQLCSPNEMEDKTMEYNAMQLEWSVWNGMGRN